MSETREHPKWRSFIAWLNASDVARGKITTEDEWGAANGVTSRTLRRWKQDPAFIALRDNLQPATTVTSEVITDDGSDEASYRLVKAKLVEGARSGNAKALELYFKTYGKPFVEDEAAARSLDLENLELPGLVVRALESLAPEELETALRDRGWTITRPTGD